MYVRMCLGVGIFRLCLLMCAAVAVTRSRQKGSKSPGLGPLGVSSCSALSRVKARSFRALGAVGL